MNDSDPSVDGLVDELRAFRDNFVNIFNRIGRPAIGDRLLRKDNSDFFRMFGQLRQSQANEWQAIADVGRNCCILRDRVLGDQSTELLEETLIARRIKIKILIQMAWREYFGHKDRQGNPKAGCLEIRWRKAEMRIVVVSGGRQTFAPEVMNHQTCQGVGIEIP